MTGNKLQKETQNCENDSNTPRNSTDISDILKVMQNWRKNKSNSNNKASTFNIHEDCFDEQENPIDPSENLENFTLQLTDSDKMRLIQLKQFK